MNNSEQRYCTYCGGTLEPFNDFHFRCLKCQRVIFQNPIPAMCVLMIENEKLLYVRRARNPRKGSWDFPGGFLEPGENVEQATKRECKEELGINVKVGKVFGTYADIYCGDGYTSTVLNVYIFCERGPGELVPDDDVDGYAWFPLAEPPDNIAFKHMRVALTDLQRVGKNNQSDQS